MKFVILSFLFPFYIFGINCQDIKTDLLALENKIQNTCIDQKEDGSCCNLCEEGSENCDQNNIKLRCIRKKDLEALYNEKLAELIIAEGIASLKLGVETNQNALNDLTAEQLDQAKKKLKAFEKASTHLRLFDLMLDEQGGKSLFYDYYNFKASGGSLADYLEQTCKMDHFSRNRFCNEYKNSNHPDFLVKVQGFLNADQMIGNDDELRKKRYKNYQNAISLKTASGKAIKPRDLKEQHPAFKETLEIKDIVNAYDVTPSKQNAKVLLSALNNLSDLGAIGIDSQAGDQLSTAVEFLKTDINLPKDVLNFPELFLDGAYGDYFNNTYKRITKDVNSHTQALLSQTNYNTIENLKSACNSNGLDDYGVCNESLNFLNKQKNAKNLMAAAKECMKEKQSSSRAIKQKEKISCLKNLLPDSSSNIAKLRRELSDLERAKNRQDNEDIFKKLNLKKAMGIKALSLKNCAYTHRETIDGIDSTDCSPNSTLSSDYEFSQFILNNQDISLNLNNDLLNNTLADLEDKDLLKDYKESFINNCENTTLFKRDALCEYFIDDKRFKDKLNEQINAKVTKDRLQMIENTENTRLKLERKKQRQKDIIYDSLATSFLNMAPAVANSYFQTAIMEDQANRAISSINAYDEFYMNYRNQYLSQSNNPNAPFYNASNFGQGFMGTSFYDYQNFQLTNQNNIFRDPTNPVQYSLSLPNPTLLPDPLGQSNTYIDKKNRHFQKYSFTSPLNK